MARPRGHRLNPDRLDDYLIEKGTTITSVAEAANMTRATLSGLYGGHHAASVPVAHQLAQGMGVSVGSLFPTLSGRYTASEAAA